MSQVYHRIKPLLVATLFVVVPLLIWLHPRSIREKKIPLAFFDWQPRTALAPSTRELLEREACETYVRTGSWAQEDGRWIFHRELSPLRAHDYAGLSWTAALRIELSPGKNSVSFPKEEAWPALLDQAASELALWQGYGARGLMLDIDCNTADLWRYAHFLTALRDKIGSASLSVTVLPSWMTRPLAFWRLTRPLDLYAPLFFGGDIAAKLQDLKPFATSDSLSLALWLGRAYGKPMVYGLGAYQLALVYNSAGRLLSVESDLSCRDLFGAPGLHYLGSQADGPGGGWRHRFHATEPVDLASRHFEAGWQILVQEPDQKLLHGQVERIRQGAGGTLKGLAFYRLDKDGAGLAWKPEAVAELLSPSPWEEAFAKPSLRLVKKKAGIWIFDLRLDYLGLLPTRLGGDPVRLSLRFKDAELLEAWPGDFATLEWGQGLEDQFSPSSPARANSVRFLSPRLEPMSSLRSGRVLLRPKGPGAAVYLSSSLESPLAMRKNVIQDFQAYPIPEQP